MSHIRNILIGVFAASALTSVAHAQASATVSTNASVTIFRPITLTKDADLSFGNVVRPGTGSGTVTVTAGATAPDLGARTNTGTVVLLSNGPNSAWTSAKYTVGGEGGQTYSITVPASFNMTRTGGSETINVILTGTATTGTLSNSLGAAGSGYFGVGGAITLTDSTASGEYTGTYNTTVAYN